MIYPLNATTSIKRFRNDVELIDLHTGFVMCAFEKLNPSEKFGNWCLKNGITKIVT